MEKPCTLLVHFDKGSPAMANEIKAELESGDGPAKADAMRRAISLLLNGEPLPHLFITVVRYVQSCDDHAVQKLLLLYLETVDKRDAATGKVLPEMILICQNLRNNLQSPNEYIRGVTLRFLCRLAEPELLEPLVPSILANLDHRHHFVRRHALSAVAAIYRRQHGDQLIPDAPELVERPLQLAVVQLGERVEPRVVAGDAVVVARGAREQSEHVRRAAERRHPRGHHRPRAGGERGLCTDS